MLGMEELLIVSFLFLTAVNCFVTYLGSSSCIKRASKHKDYVGSIKKLRIYDNYIFTTLLMITSVIYVALSYFYFKSTLKVSDYFITFATIGGFVLTSFTTFFSRLCYCYACNFILKTKLNEFDCFMVNTISLAKVFYPLFVVSFVVPTIYVLPYSMQTREILIGVFLGVFVLFYIATTTLFNMLTLGARRIKKGKIFDVVSSLFKEHHIKKYRIYYWDSSKSNDSNAMVMGFSRVNFFISSSLVQSLDDKELEAVILHEIGHIKHNHIKSNVIQQTIYLSAIAAVLYYAIISDATNIGFMLLLILVFLLLMGLSVNVSKKQEDEADLYVAKHGLGDSLISALRKISVDGDEGDTIHGSVEDRHENIKSKK